MKNGDSASGRYFVNGEESYTDVQYIADKLGYHPVVKYRSSSGRRSTTQSTVNRNAQKLQHNDTNIVSKIINIKLSRINPSQSSNRIK